MSFATLVSGDSNIELSLKFFSVEKRSSIALFLLKIVLNIEKYHKDFCICKNNDICYVCVAAKIYDGASNQLFKNCLNLDFLIKFKARMYGTICFLQEQNSHFVCTILEKEFYYKQKCFFSGNNVKISLRAAYEEWEKLKKKKLLITTALLNYR